MVKYDAITGVPEFVEYVDINLYLRDINPKEMYLSEKITGFNLIVETLSAPRFKYLLRPNGQHGHNFDLEEGEILQDGMMEMIMRNDVLDATLGILELPKGAHHDFLYIYPTVSDMKMELARIKSRQDQIVAQLNKTAPVSYTHLTLPTILLV